MDLNTKQNKRKIEVSVKHEVEKHASKSIPLNSVELLLLLSVVMCTFFLFCFVHRIIELTATCTPYSSLRVPKVNACATNFQFYPFFPLQIERIVSFT